MATTDPHNHDTPSDDEVTESARKLIEAVRRRFTANGALDFAITLEEAAKERGWPWEIREALQQTRLAIADAIWEKPERPE